MKWIPLASAFIISLLWAMTIPNSPISDQIIYDYTARTLAEGKGYIDHSGNPTAFWAPGYSFYLAFFYKILGPSYFSGFIANLFSYAALVYGVYFLGSELYDYTTGVVAATFAALYPTFILYNTILASEILFSALVVWSFYFLWKSYSTANAGTGWTWAIPAGVFLGMASLTRSQALILPIMAVVMGWIKKSSWSKIAGRFLLASLLMVLVCLPWGIRNHTNFGKFVLVSANFGVNLWTGNHEGATGYYVDLDALPDDKKEMEGNVVERDEALKKKAFAFIVSHPMQFIWLSIKRFFLSLRSESIAVVWNQAGIEKAWGAQWLTPLKIATNVGWYFLLLGVTWGILLHFHARVMHRPDWIPVTAIFFLSTAFVFFHIQDRYHLPLVPFMMLFFAHSIVEKNAVQEPLKI